MTPHVMFAAGPSGVWRLDSLSVLAGDPWPRAERIAVLDAAPPPADAAWVLRGAISNMRYTERVEADALARVQETTGRLASTRAALILIRKTEAWWALAQDERRAILEAKSHHIANGMAVLPAVARRLHHCRELGGPFDFLTWFEYAPADEPSFDALLAVMRPTPEWGYVDREVDIRLTRDA